jgi:adenosylmethionine-8-amino-7-oxononanoate aminotransferase
LGKGLTGGYLPMAATVARPKVFRAFLGTATESKQFYHGHTFGGNPLAAAAALASIELFGMDDSGETDLVAVVDRKAKRIRDRLSPLRDHPHVGDIRGRGLMVGIELVKDRETKTPFDSDHQLGRRVCQQAVERGVWIRPLTDVIVAMPPLVASDDELDFLADVIIDSVHAAASEN